MIRVFTHTNLHLRHNSFRSRTLSMARCTERDVEYPRVHIFQEKRVTVIDFLLRREYNEGDEEILRHYVNDVGNSINVSVLDRKTLRDKVNMPWLYPELSVRVNGHAVDQ